MSDPISKLLAAPERVSPATVDAPFDLDTKLCTATYVVSSSAIDNDGDILVPEGSLPHLDRYRNNPVVLWNHDRDCIPIAQSVNPVTKQLSWDVMDGLCVKATACFHLMTQESAQCWGLVEAGVLRGASVGYDSVPGKSLRLAGKGMKFVEWAPYEWSIVPIPCNPETLLEAVHRNWDGKSLSPLIKKSLMAHVPKSNKVIVSLVGTSSYVKSQIPWVQSDNVKEKQMAEDTQTQDAVTPPGAQAIMGFTADLEAALANLNTALPQIENEAVLTLFEGIGTALGEQVTALKDGLASIYPDLQGDVEAEADAKDETAEEETAEQTEEVKEDDTEEEKADDEEEEPKKAKKIKADGEHGPHIAAIQDASELCKEMGDSPNVPKSYRMACKSAAGGLSGACDYMSKAFSAKAEDGKPEDEKPEDTKEEEPEEEKADEEVTEEDAKAIKALVSDLANLRKELKKTTGKVS